MSDKKISELTASTTPLAGTEVLPIVQSGATKKTSVESVLTSVQPSGTANGILHLSGSKVATSGSALTFDGTNLLRLSTTLPEMRIASTNAGVSSGTVIGKTSFYTSDPTTPGGAGEVAKIEARSTSGNGSDYALRISKRAGSFGGAVYGEFGTSSGSILFATNNDTPQLEIKSNGDVSVLTGNLVIGTAGKGIDFSGGVLWRTGTGSPEGVVTASVGSMYTDVAGGAGTTLYVKESGAGNTGWVAK